MRYALWKRIDFVWPLSINHVWLFTCPTSLASPLPACQSAAGGACWGVPAAPDSPSTPLPWLPSAGTEELEANAHSGSTVARRQNRGWGEPGNTSAEQCLRR